MASTFNLANFLANQVATLAVNVATALGGATLTVYSLVQPAIAPPKRPVRIPEPVSFVKYFPRKLPEINVVPSVMPRLDNLRTLVRTASKQHTKRKNEDRDIRELTEMGVL